MARKKFSETTLLTKIAAGDDAHSIIMERLPSAEARFEKLDKAMRDYLAFVRRAFPDAMFYTGGGGFNLMLGSDHAAEYAGRAVGQQELIAFSGLAEIGDGDF